MSDDYIHPYQRTKLTIWKIVDGKWHLIKSRRHDESLRDLYWQQLFNLVQANVSGLRV